uniref:Uncharacterized protein n=1 Tax=Anopheles arabiensis TaxID=7173 RepID=A0A182IFP5_ANOAR
MFLLRCHLRCVQMSITLCMRRGGDVVPPLSFPSKK